METWFTSDTHFSHKAIMKFCPETRPYANKDEMNEAMVEHWNSMIAPTDDVWHFGDVSFAYKFQETKEVLAQLNGRINLIYGNHDRDIIRNRDELVRGAFFYSMQHYHEMKFDGRFLVMCHFPFAVWHKNHHGSFNLYGHCHGSFKAVGKQCDVGWDTADFPGRTPGPIHWEEIKKLLDSREVVVQDHHDPVRITREPKE